MATIELKLVGRSPLMLHNIRLADPDDDFAKQIAILTHKRVKTEEDRKAIAKLEWYGSLYLSANGAGVVLPTANLRKCLIQTAKVSKLGTALGRALHFADAAVPIQYDGPRDLQQLYEIPTFSDRRAVGVSGSRTMRTRPIFRAWAVEAIAEVIEDVMDLEAVRRVVEMAGLIEGLGDNRINGYGRFEGVVHA